MTRNIVLIGSDSIRADHCSCYGYHRETTPFIDSLAKEGVKFENPIVSGLATPTSFMGIFTGNYSPVETELIRRQDWQNALDPRKTLAQALSENGYHTYGFNTNALLSRYYGFNKGFEYYYDGLWTMKGKHGWWWKAKKFSFLPFLRKMGLAGHIINLKNFIKADIGYTRTEEWIGNVLNTKLEEPYFLWIFLVDTHHPYVPPKEYARWGEIGTRRMIWLNYKMRRQGKGEVAAEESRWAMAQQRFESKLNPKEHETIVDAYDGEILHVDSIVEELWRHLENTDPVFIFHSDHGDGLGEHGFYGHPPEHYEYMIRVPLVIYNADWKGSIEEPVSFLSLPSTICKIAGIESGFSYPTFFDNAAYSPPTVQNRLRNGLRITIRDKEWKLTTNPDREDELYNIKEDPREKENLAGSGKKVEEELRAHIENYRRSIETGDEKARIKRKVGELKISNKI